MKAYSGVTESGRALFTKVPASKLQEQLPAGSKMTGSARGKRWEGISNATYISRKNMEKIIVFEDGEI